MTDTRLRQLLDRVSDETTFLEFAAELVRDRELDVENERVTPSPPSGASARGWENGTIEAFLDAAVRWASSSGFGQTLPDHRHNPNPWNQFAWFLYAGKAYE